MLVLRMPFQQLAHCRAAERHHLTIALLDRKPAPALTVQPPLHRQPEAALGFQDNGNGALIALRAVADRGAVRRSHAQRKEDGVDHGTLPGAVGPHDRGEAR